MIQVVLAVFLSLAFSAGADEAMRTAEKAHDTSARRPRAIERTGTVIVPPLYPRAPFHVASDDQILILYDLRKDRSAKISEGDNVRMAILVKTERDATFEDPLGCLEIAILSHGDVPNPTPLGIREFTRNFQPNRHVELTGTVRDVFPDDIDPHYAFVILQDGEDFAYLAYPGGTDMLPAFRALRGSVVAASGVTWNTGNRHIGKSILAIAGTNAFRVVRHADSRRFDALPINASSLNIHGDIASPSLRKTSGTVVATWHGDTFLLIDTNGSPVKVELSDPSPPAVSECVEAVGYPETDLFDLSLVRASWRRLEPASRATFPVKSTSIKDIFVSLFGQYRIPVAEHGKTLRVTGTVKSILLDEQGRKRLLVADGGYTIPVDCSNLKSSVEEVPEGCLVQVTGVCVKDSDIWRPSFMIPRVRGLFLVPRSDADLKVLRRPPWWTPVRFVVALTILFGVIVAILVWNATLRVLVVRKSRAVLREQAAKIEETLKIDERTRLAAELHDYLAQNLTVISYQISAAESALAADSAEAADCLRTADRMLLSCRADLRRCLWDLKSDALNEPEFAKAIKRTSEPVAGDARLLVRFAANRSRLSDSTAHAVLSICRELVSNAVQHGKADKVQIAGELRDGAIRFSVRDNGGGFDPAKRPGQADGHFGLDGVAERIRRFNGQLRIDSRPGRGTRIVVTLRPKEPQT